MITYTNCTTLPESKIMEVSGTMGSFPAARSLCTAADASRSCLMQIYDGRMQMVHIYYY